MKLLFTTPLLGAPPIGGPELRVANSIKALAKLAELHVFPRCAVSESTQRFLNETCKNTIPVPVLTRNTSIVARGFRRGMNQFFPKIVVSKEIARQASIIVRYAKRENINAIWFAYGCISYSLMRSVKRSAPHLRLICDTDSIWSQFLSRYLPFQTSTAKRNEIMREVKNKIAEEKRWVNFCDVTTAVCEADAKYYREIARNLSAVFSFRNAIDVNAYEADVPPPSPHRKPNLVIMGSYGERESPMDQSARWIVANVLPHVRAVIPEVHLYIVGTGSDRHLKDLQSDTITVTGMVESTLPYLKHANVALAPLLFEAAGAKFKVLEAAVCEVPVVATPVGAEGLPAEYLKYIRVCHEPKEFASSILDMIRKDTGKMEQLREFKGHIAREFGLEKLGLEAAEILRHVGLA